MMSTLLFLVRRDLEHDRWRVVLGIVVVAAIVFVYLATDALAGTLQELSRATEVSRNLVVVEGDIIDPADATLLPEAVAAAEALGPDMVERVSPVVFRHQRLSGRLLQLRAAPREDWQAVHHITLVSGRWPTADDEILVTEGVAQVLGSEVGDSLILYGTEFRVAGIGALVGTPFAVVWLDLAQALRLFSHAESYQLMVVKAAPGASLDEVREAVRSLPAIRDHYEVFFEDTYTRQNVEFLDDLGQTSRALSALALLALIFGVYNSSGLLITERRNEHAILRALGFEPSALRQLVVMHAGMQAMAGFGIGVLTLLLLAARRTSMSQLYVFGWPLRFAPTVNHVVTGFVLTVGLSGAGAFAAARQTRPVDN